VEKVNSYLISHFKVTQAQYSHLRSLLPEVSENTWRLFSHILACTVLLEKRTSSGTFPVPFELIHRKLRSAAWSDLEELNVIEVTGYSQFGGLCREFKAVDEVVQDFIEKAPVDALLYLEEPLVNLVTGRASGSPYKSVLYDSAGNSEPKLITNALNAIKPCVFDLYAVKRHVEKLYQLWQQAKGTALEKTARARYNNDLSCFRAVLNQQPKRLHDGLWAFQSAYTVQSTGRVGQVAGGLQSCSREMKQTAFERVPNLRNYDLKASQPTILIQEFERAGLDPTWLNSYLADPDAKYKHAQSLGISVDTWKRCLMALVMGGEVTKHKKKDYYACDITQYLAEDLQNSLADLDNAIDKFKSLVAPLNTQLKKWHSWLVTYYAERKNHSIGKGKKRYVTNQTGKHFYLGDHKSNELPRKLAAFVLQGRESCYIHTLTTLSSEYGYKVLANEHDGLIVLGEVPEEATARAAAASGIRAIRLEQKSFT
jgi:hypothetical protein